MLHTAVPILQMPKLSTSPKVHGTQGETADGKAHAREELSFSQRFQQIVIFKIVVYSLSFFFFF